MMWEPISLLPSYFHCASRWKVACGARSLMPQRTDGDVPLMRQSQVYCESGAFTEEDASTM